MGKLLALNILAIITNLLFTDRYFAAEVDVIQISLLPESENPIIENDKSILRYGFHRTSDCKNFEKAFICIRKCLDLNYHIAQADDKCICTCYKNSVLAKYKAHIDSALTKKVTAPTTAMPAWASGNIEKKPKDYEINENYTEYITKPSPTTVEPLTLKPEDDFQQSTTDGEDITETDNNDGATTDVTGGTESSIPEETSTDLNVESEPTTESVNPEIA